MQFSVIVPYRGEENLEEFLKSVKSICVSNKFEYELLLVKSIKYPTMLKNNIKELKQIEIDEDDLQKLVMAGIDNTNSDAVIIITPKYSAENISLMYKNYMRGYKLVAFAPLIKNKFKRFIRKLSLAIFNLGLKYFSDIFSLGIYRDIELIDKEIIDIMKSNARYAHRIRTIYAFYDYKHKIIEVEKPVTDKSLKNELLTKPVIGSCVSIGLISVISLFALILMIINNVNIFWYILLGVLFIIFELLGIALLIATIANVKIGILYPQDENGKIYALSLIKKKGKRKKNL